MQTHNTKMKAILQNISALTSEYGDTSDIEIVATSHQEEDNAWTMVTVRHLGPTTRKHVGLALDYSGSMSNCTKDGVVKKNRMVEAAKMAVQQLPEDDLITVVAYGTTAVVLVENARIGHPSTLARISSKMGQQCYLGGTNPSSALTLLTDCDQTLLLSDGEFNDGPIDPVVLYSIVNRPLLCGSIFPGNDMNDLANISEGTFFELDCNNKDSLTALLSSALCAPKIMASSVLVRSGDCQFNLPSIRAGCSVHTVIPGSLSEFSVDYMNSQGAMMTIEYHHNWTSKFDETVHHNLVMQRAAKLAEMSALPEFVDQRLTMEHESQELFESAGIEIKNRADFCRASSAQRLQFSIDPDSVFCPELSRSCSQSVLL